jgi:hypothetical protein
MLAQNLLHRFGGAVSLIQKIFLSAVRLSKLFFAFMDRENMGDIVSFVLILRLFSTASVTGKGGQ